MWHRLAIAPVVNNGVALPRHNPDVRQAGEGGQVATANIRWGEGDADRPLPVLGRMGRVCGQVTVTGWVRAWGLVPQAKALSWQERGLSWVWVAARQVVKEWGMAEARVMGLGMGWGLDHRPQARGEPSKTQGRATAPSMSLCGRKQVLDTQPTQTNSQSVCKI